MNHSYSMPRRKKKNQSMKASLARKVWWRRMGWLGVILLGVVVGYHLVPHALAKWTTIQHVSISGVKYMKRGEILSLLDLLPESSLSTIDPTRLEQRIEMHPRIAAASVGRGLPHTLTVVIQEREPAAAFQHAGGQLFLDQEGVVLSIAPDDEVPELPIFSGLSAIKLLEGDPTTREQARFGVTVAKLLHEQFAETFHLDFREPSEIVAMTKNMAFLVNQDIHQAWKQYLALEPTIQAGLPTEPYEIDLRYSDKVIVRQRG